MDELRRSVVGLALVLMSLIPSATASAAEDRNWITIQIWDSFFPMTEEKSFPENLNAIEIMFHHFTKRKLNMDIAGFFGQQNPYRLRSREGHYMIWLHVSDRYLRQHGMDRAAIGENLFIHRGRDNDIFTGWGGTISMGDLLRKGISGMAMPTQRPDGTFLGERQGIDAAYAMGDADFAGGWYISDEQALAAVRALTAYPGIQKGYSFLLPSHARPNAPYDPPGAQMVNGYNCNDFAYYMLDAAGVVPLAEAEQRKISLWYPREYYDRPLPLSALGQKGKEWFDRNPTAMGVPDSVMAEMAWADLLFAPYGLEFFNKQQIFTETWQNRLTYLPARVWDQRKSMDWLRTRAQFDAKGAYTELRLYAQSGERIPVPYRRIAKTAGNFWLFSNEYLGYHRQGLDLEFKKLRRNGIVGGMRDHFMRHLERLKVYLQ